MLVIDNASIHHSYEWNEFVELTGIYVINLAAYCPWMNLVEWIFNGIKMVEQNKQIKGEYQSILSLYESTHSMKNKSWHKVLKRLGYIE